MKYLSEIFVVQEGLHMLHLKIQLISLISIKFSIGSDIQENLKSVKLN